VRPEERTKKEIDMKVFISAVLMFLWVSPAAAGLEGSVLINQARALAGGISPGDTPGFPITISQAGTYALVSNLVPTNDNVNVIEINTSDGVTLDLNRFSILGGGTCTFDVVDFNVTSCTNTGTGNGIYSLNNSITIRNGSILGMGTWGST
jgi:hypothetical protein